ASSKKHKNTGSIFVINLFLGWTLLGWVTALAMALSYDDTKQEYLEKDDNSDDDFDDTPERLKNIKKLLDNNFITEEEYNKKRTDILQDL
ncbi:superinfection immunity protein, partial [Alphaproteobacteria bacterium]|nr:superinfection immunity protein [Alphaproteobacteria bacterium]